MWMKLLTEAVARSSRAAVAVELDISRTTVSLVLDGKYPASTDKIAERVLNTYGRVECPHLGAEITLAECRMHHSANVPTSSPRAMKQWRACQGCPFNTAKGGKS